MKIIEKYHVIIYILLVMCASIIILYKVSGYGKEKSIVIDRKNIVDEQVPTKDNLPTIDFEKLRKKYNNKDIKGAIRINGDKFEQIVFQTSNNTYYLTHNYNKKKTNGEIFLDKSQDIDTSKIKKLYGTGSKSSNVFKNYYNDLYYRNHKYLELETDKQIYVYEVLLVYSGDIDCDDFDINRLIKNSLYTYNLDFDENNEYLIIETLIDNKEISIVSKKVK